MYRSPIEVICREIETQVGIKVDKEQLLHALEYDRNQYQKGYIDGYADCFDEAKTESVSLSAYKQVAEERDIAMEQLKEHGIPFGCIAPDVVEVVRCKDCKHRRDDLDFASGHYCVIRPSNGGRFCEDNDFCSYGERKETWGDGDEIDLE